MPVGRFSGRTDGGPRPRDGAGMMPIMRSDARLHPRFRVEATADVIGEEVVLAREVADISLGGCRFAFPAWEVAGVEVQLVLSFPSLDVNLPLGGVVVRATDSDLAVRFTNLSDEQKWALRKHLRELQERIAV